MIKIPQEVLLGMQGEVSGHSTLRVGEGWWGEVSGMNIPENPVRPSLQHSFWKGIQEASRILEARPGDNGGGGSGDTRVTWHLPGPPGPGQGGGCPCVKKINEDPNREMILP